MQTCTHCGSSLRDAAKFCKECGTPTPEVDTNQTIIAAPPPPPAEHTMIDTGSTITSESPSAPCTNCASPIRPGAQFCTECGTPAPGASSGPSTLSSPTIIVPAAGVPAPGDLVAPPPAGPAPVILPPSNLPPSEPRRKVPPLLLVLGVLLLALVVGGAAFLIGSSGDDPESVVAPGDDDDTSTTTTVEDPTTTTTDTSTSTSTSTTTSSTTTTEPEPVVREGWVLQLASIDVADTAKRDELLAEWQQVIPEATTILSDDWASLRSGFWVIIGPGPYESGTSAADVCREFGLDRNACLGRYLSTNSADSDRMCWYEDDAPTSGCF